VRTHPFTFTAEKFWARMRRDDDGCLRWSGRTDRDGYGRLRKHGTRRGAHQVAWELTYGPIPDGLCVLHRCDHPPCCDPEHLFLGTNQDNNADKVAKGRGTQGEQVALAKLNPAAVRLIRSSKATTVVLGRLLGVSDVAVGLVRRGRTWRHVA